MAPGEKLLAEVQKQADAAGKVDWVVSIDRDRARASARRDTEAGRGGSLESQGSVDRTA